MAVLTLARLGLGVLPTPLRAAPALAARLGLTGALLVKRDDLTGFAFGGNKVRQLELLLGAARQQDADVLVTGGGIGSNFVAAAAAGAVHLGVRNVAVLAGPPRPRTAHPNLAAALAFGAEPVWTGEDDRSSVDRVQQQVTAELRAGGSRPYLVPRGGATATGSLGYRLAVDELCAQLPAGTAPTVVVATGSGGTLAGLVAGLVAQGRPFPVVGVSVSRPVAQVRERVLALAREVAEARGEPPAGEGDVRLVDGRGPGHGLASAEGRRAARAALVAEGLLLDPVYTAKALAALPEVVGADPAVFWHTGGVLDAVAEQLTADAQETT